MEAVDEQQASSTDEWSPCWWSSVCDDDEQQSSATLDDGCELQHEEDSTGFDTQQESLTGTSVQSVWCDSVDVAHGEWAVDCLSVEQHATGQLSAVSASRSEGGSSSQSPLSSQQPPQHDSDDSIARSSKDWMIAGLADDCWLVACWLTFGSAGSTVTSLCSWQPPQHDSALLNSVSHVDTCTWSACESFDGLIDWWIEWLCGCSDDWVWSQPGWSACPGNSDISIDSINDSSHDCQTPHSNCQTTRWQGFNQQICQYEQTKCVTSDNMMNKLKNRKNFENFEFIYFDPVEVSNLGEFRVSSPETLFHHLQRPCCSGVLCGDHHFWIVFHVAAFVKWQSQYFTPRYAKQEPEARNFCLTVPFCCLELWCADVLCFGCQMDSSHTYGSMFVWFRCWWWSHPFTCACVSCDLVIYHQYHQLICLYSTEQLGLLKIGRFE